MFIDNIYLVVTIKDQSMRIFKIKLYNSEKTHRKFLNALDRVLENINNMFFTWG